MILQDQAVADCDPPLRQINAGKSDNVQEQIAIRDHAGYWGRSAL
jgi:hypothetical protein